MSLPKIIPAGVFRLGVASGDPLPGGVLLGTRLAPDSGMPGQFVHVHWEIAEDDRFRKGRRTGVAVARPEQGHAVQVDVRGLRPDAGYFYRFRVAGQLSPVGRTRTAPARSSHPRHLRFAVAGSSCTAYERLAGEEDLAFVVLLGDETADCHDPALQAARAAFPWIVTGHGHLPVSRKSPAYRFGTLADVHVLGTPQPVGAVPARWNLLAGPHAGEVSNPVVLAERLIENPCGYVVCDVTAERVRHRAGGVLVPGLVRG